MNAKQGGIHKGAMTLNIIKLNIMTRSIMGLFATLSLTVLIVIMLSVAIFYCYPECRGALTTLLELFRVIFG